MSDLVLSNLTIQGHPVGLFCPDPPPTFDEVTIGNYVGQKYQEIEAQLKKDGIQVIIETKPTNDKSKYQADVIIEQSVEEGSKLTPGDIIRLSIESLEVLYPDFTTFTIDGVTNFCEENKVDLIIDYKETTTVEPGSIISQSRAAGNVVRPNTSVTIVVAKIPAAMADPETAGE